IDDFWGAGGGRGEGAAGARGDEGDVSGIDGKDAGDRGSAGVDGCGGGAVVRFGGGRDAGDKEGLFVDVDRDAAVDGGVVRGVGGREGDREDLAVSGVQDGSAGG